MLCREVQNYISTVKGLPFFYVVGDEDYHSAFADLTQAGLSVIRMSDFCPKEDRFPSVDELVDHFRTSDIDYRDNKFVVVGLGEYLALKGNVIAEQELLRLKNTTLGNARVVLLLRGVASQASKIINDDKKMVEQNRAFVSDNLITGIKITNMLQDNGSISQKGIKPLLKTLEDGACKRVFAHSELLLDYSLFPVTTLDSSYSVIKYLVKDFNVDEKYGTEEQWNRLLKDLQKNSKSLKEVFNSYNVDEQVLDELYYAVLGLEYKNWLVFLFFKENVDAFQNSYLRTVINNTDCFDEFKNNLITFIVSVSPKDVSFKSLYYERKKLLKDFPEEDIAIFVKANEVDPEESIYRLTDNTMIEKKEIVKWIAHHGIPDAISYVYPDLQEYLKRYIFDPQVLSGSQALADELTEYFDEYKKLKITNHISDEFMELVEKYAQNFIYTKLPTRDNAIKAIKDKNGAFLYWIDALGVEYLSYITALANKKGLSVHTDIVRSDLPTITPINKLFYEQWDGEKFKEDQLDNIKHKEKGDFFFTKDEDPIHVPAELAVIEKAINTAAMKLGMHQCSSFIIASDHGASRLAVIKKQEIPYDTDTKGEHSGRCCKTFEGCDAPYSFEENGFIILSDYGRFRGSRAANVEVHGGASLEEIVVPLITLTLKKQTNVQIKVLQPDDIIADRHEGVTLHLYVSDVEVADKLSLVIDGKQYLGKAEDKTHFTFELKDIKRAKSKPYIADVFDADDLIGSISFSVKGKTATIKEDFDFDDEF